jgi:hypothetical protein
MLWPGRLRLPPLNPQIVAVLERIRNLRDVRQLNVPAIQEALVQIRGPCPARRGRHVSEVSRRWSW